MAVQAIFDDFFGQQGQKYTNFSLFILNKHKEKNILKTFFFKISRY